MNLLLVNRWLASLFVRSSSFAQRDGSLFTNLYGITVQFNAYRSIQFVIDHEVETPGLYIQIKIEILDI